MTARDKAKELVEMYLDTTIDFPYIDSEDGQCIGSGYMTLGSAKKCAIIAVDKIISVLSEKLDFNMLKSGMYYLEVKSEIENLWKDI